MNLFQEHVRIWTKYCFGLEVANDKTERNHRFLEEALELVQACGCTAEDAHKLVDYVFGRPVGERSQEVGGVMVTLAALCGAQKLDMMECGQIELDRVNTDEMIAKIRAKQAAKPKIGPLPEGKTIWRHKKRGTTYDIVGKGELQINDDWHDGTELVIYRSREDGRLWARPEREFYDGRFERVFIEPDPEMSDEEKAEQYHISNTCGA